MPPKKPKKKPTKKAPKKTVKKTVKKAPKKKAPKTSARAQSSRKRGTSIEETEELDEVEEEELDLDEPLEGEEEEGVELEDFEIDDLSDEDKDDDLDLDEEPEIEEEEEDEEEKPKKKKKKGSSENKLESFNDFMSDDEDEEEQQALFDDDILDNPKPRKKKNKKHDIPLKLYRRIALGFIVITGALLLFMLVFSATSATIDVTPNKEQISVSLLRTVGGTTDRIEGAVFVEEVTHTQTFSVAEGKEVEGNATGQMKIINNTDKAVSLIPRTRFQSEGGVIFRIAKRVNVPAKGNITAAVTADVVGTAGDVKQGKFTIPGLPDAEQVNVYGESVGDMSGGVRIAGVLAESDIVKARGEIEAELKKSKLDQYKDDESTQSYPDNIASVEILGETVNGEVGAEVDQFSIDMRANVTAVFFDGSALDTLTRQAVFAKVASDKRLHKVGDPRYEVEKVDATAKTATLKLMRDGTVTLDPGSALVAPEKFVNMNYEAVDTYMEATGAVADHELKIRPRWRKKTPGSAERIKVKVNIE